MCRALAYCHFVSIQVLTGAVPFGNASPVTAMLSITQGKRPPRPTHPAFTGNLWALMQRCWDQEPHLRPEVSEVLQVILTPSAAHSFQKSYFREINYPLAHSENPAWKQLISDTVTADQRISLITMIFSDHNQAEMIGHLSGDDAQSLIGVTNEVSPKIL